MKIAFLCGSLEPGFDGVGDYTRQLAVELIRLGHAVIAIAICDFNIDREYRGYQRSEEVSLTVLRIPAVTNFSERLKRIKDCIDLHNPDWISFQFVPYSFHAQGLVFKLAWHLKMICRRARCQLMMHELWVGMDENATIKRRCLGWLQRQSIKLLIHRLKPVIISTQSLLYAEHLCRLGYQPKYLPLFSNINNQFIDEGRSVGESVNKLSLVLFGSIHPDTAVDDFADDIANYKAKMKSDVCLIFLGNCGALQEHWVNVWKAKGLPLKILGQQPPNVISGILRTAALGIATTPTALLDKSGSVAAMREHGLTVLAVTSNWRPRGIKVPALPPGIIKFTKGNLEQIIKAKTYIPHDLNVAKVARKLEGLLLRYS